MIPMMTYRMMQACGMCQSLPGRYRSALRPAIPARMVAAQADARYPLGIQWKIKDHNRPRMPLRQPA